MSDVEGESESPTSDVVEAAVEVPLESSETDDVASNPVPLGAVSWLSVVSVVERSLTL